MDAAHLRPLHARSFATLLNAWPCLQGFGRAKKSERQSEGSGFVVYLLSISMCSIWDGNRNQYSGLSTAALSPSGPCTDVA